MKLNSPLTDVKGVGEMLAKKFDQLGLKTIHDLVEYYPRRYDDYSEVTLVAHIKPGPVTIQAEIKQAAGRYVRRGMHITEAVASDATGSVRLIWFNQPYRSNALKKGQAYYISGEFQLGRGRLNIMNPSVELVSDFPVNTARIVPIYRETKGLKSTQIRKTIKQCLSLVRTLEETLPAWLVEAQKLPSHAWAVEQMHFPSSSEQLIEAKRRLGFEEVFSLTLAALYNKQEVAQEKSVQIEFDETLAKSFVKSLPFSLTDDQRKSVWQIYKDMQRAQPMNRLLEGDVGSGKTVVAAMAAMMAIRQGYQVALMAPTEILARQHAETLYKIFEPIGMAGTIGLLIGSLKPAQKKLAQNKIAAGEISFIVGTHALIQEKVDIHKLGLIIVDEQHRFGVGDRKKLQAKAGHAVHMLSMTATPIPRSLALTLFGEMDISVLAQKPAGRKSTNTKIVSPNSRKQLYEKIDIELEAGRQMFVVTPLISESSILDAVSAEDMYEALQKKHFKHRRVGLLHGGMKTEDKDEVMQRFLNHDLDILVSTTVIEVGVNVPNATVMLIENAERFGLAQIHQLRGRVGRSDQQGYAYLMLGDSKAPSRRLRALESSNDGFKLAELDLEIRGPGAIYGTLQHGQLDLRIAKLTDVQLIATARASAQEFIDKNEKLIKYPQLHERIQYLRAVTNLN